MKREIKFRVFYRGRLFGYERLNENNVWEFMVPELNPENFERWTPGMIAASTGERNQFTGLKDKNGKEIWEGDIVAHPCKNFPFTIEFRDGGFAMWHSMVCNYDLCNQMAIGCEIVGNIYENEPKQIAMDMDSDLGAQS